MKKFHDEFFKKGSAEHDKLVLKCASREGKHTIIKTIEKAFPNFRATAYSSTFAVFPPPVGATIKKEKIWICKSNPFCRETSLAHREHPVCAEKIIYTENWNKKCEYFVKEKAPPPANKISELEPNGKFIEAPLIVQDSQKSINCETEVICKTKTGFILGYADILLTVSGHYSILADLSEETEGWQWKDFRSIAWPETRILVEVKPKISEWGSILRQVKTYMDCLNVKLATVATYSELDARAIELLKQERIAVVKFDKSR